MRKDLNEFENEMKKASIMGAKEDNLHVSPEDHGYDLRVSAPYQTGEKQLKD